MDNRRVFAFLDTQQQAGLRTVLVSVIAVDGSSMRGPGTHMGVSEDGQFNGSLSGGCIENAVVAEALDVLAKGTQRIVRFGANSPYIDIKLPCGGGLDIHFLPLGDNEFVSDCLTSINARAPFAITLCANTAQAEFSAHWQPTHWNETSGVATLGHWPEPQLLIIGHGAVVPSLVALSQQMDLIAAVLTPDKMLLEKLGKAEIPIRLLNSPADTADVRADRWTAIVFLFHDHDWETALMAKALHEPHFYIGAMGGRKAHEWRCGALREAGCSADMIDTINAPIGLFHSARDPDTLALSTLGQIIKCYHVHDFELASD